MMMCLRFLVVVVVCFAALGCNSFKKDYNALGDAPAPVASIEGRWTGQWISERNTHSGKLRAIVTPVEGQPNQYNARFHATWGGFITGTYDVTLSTETREGDTAKLYFHGEQDLGFLYGGIYTYKGFVTPDHWQSKYDSKSDNGRWEMTRPAPGEAFGEDAKAENQSKPQNEPRP